MKHISFYTEIAMKGIVERQPEYQQGYQASIEGKSKGENPYKNWMTKNAEIKTVYWNMGFDSAELTENKEVNK